MQATKAYLHAFAFGLPVLMHRHSPSVVSLCKHNDTAAVYATIGGGGLGLIITSVDEF
jgi:rhamnose utilization protein RhaD (predicted bifunctional aldolase and dehydrogenase)